MFELEVSKQESLAVKLGILPVYGEEESRISSISVGLEARRGVLGASRAPATFTTGLREMEKILTSGEGGTRLREK
jgi:hypothetical protein